MRTRSPFGRLCSCGRVELKRLLSDVRGGVVVAAEEVEGAVCVTVEGTVSGAVFAGVLDEGVTACPDPACPGETAVSALAGTVQKIAKQSHKTITLRAIVRVGNLK
jgi:hypothetical protein